MTFIFAFVLALVLLADTNLNLSNMKKLLFMSVILLLWANNSFSQSNAPIQGGGATCDSRVFKYSGPKNTEELAALLSTSKDPVIVTLDEDTKQSLLKNMVFMAGRPKGMDGKDGTDDVDQNIQKLYATNAKEVFSALFGMEVIISTADTRPKVIEMSVSEYMQHFHDDPIGYAVKPVFSLCKNCCFGWPPIGGPYCCHVCGNGCWDAIIVLPDGNYYRIVE
jgi:hypothetical protein